MDGTFTFDTQRFGEVNQFSNSYFNEPDTVPKTFLPRPPVMGPRGPRMSKSIVEHLRGVIVERREKLKENMDQTAIPEFIDDIVNVKFDEFIPVTIITKANDIISKNLEERVGEALDELIYPALIDKFGPGIGPTFKSLIAGNIPCSRPCKCGRQDDDCEDSCEMQLQAMGPCGSNLGGTFEVPRTDGTFGVGQVSPQQGCQQQTFNACGTSSGESSCGSSFSNASSCSHKSKSKRSKKHGCGSCAGGSPCALAGPGQQCPCMLRCPCASAGLMSNPCMMAKSNCAKPQSPCQPKAPSPCQQQQQQRF